MNGMLSFLNRILSSYTFYAIAIVVLVTVILAVVGVLLLIFNNNDRLAKVIYDDPPYVAADMPANMTTFNINAL